MSDWPVNLTDPLVTIHTWSLEAIGADLTAQAKYMTAAASVVWPTAGLAIFIPFTVSKIITVKQLFVYNGTVASSSFCVGVYDAFGNRLITSASTSQSTASVVQVCDTTDTNIGPGNYYLALSASTATQSFFALTMAANIFPGITGMAQMAAAYPLPSTATFSQIAGNYIPVIGLTTRVVV